MTRPPPDLGICNPACVSLQPEQALSISESPNYPGLGIQKRSDLGPKGFDLGLQLADSPSRLLRERLKRLVGPLVELRTVRVQAARAALSRSNENDLRVVFVSPLFRLFSAPRRLSSALRSAS